MAKNNNDYWKDRFVALENESYQKGLDYIKELEDNYNKTIANCEKNIARWYQRLADNNGISMAEAKKILTKNELNEFKWSVEEYIKYGQENAINQKWIKELENASAKVHITRYEQIKLELENEINVLHSKNEQGLRDLLSAIYQKNYKQTAKLLDHNAMKGLNHIQVVNALQKPWATDENNFSDRIWNDKSKLINSLNKHLTQNIIKGESYTKAVKSIKDDLNVSRNAAKRIVVTETAAIQTSARYDCLKNLECEYYEISVANDGKVCTICASFSDLEPQRMKDFQIGITAPPFHPNCRCAIMPWYADESEKLFQDLSSSDDDIENQQKSSIIKIDRMAINNGSIDWLPKGDNLSSDEFKQLRDYAESKDIVLRGFKKSDVDIELIKEIIDDTEKMFEIYPELKGVDRKQFTLDLSYTMRNADFAETTPGVTHIVKLNGNAFRNKEKLAQEYSKLEKEHWFVKGTDYHSIIRHELGHLYGDIHEIDSLAIAKEISNKEKDELFLYISDVLSDYAAGYRDGVEIISEVFSAKYSNIDNAFANTFIEIMQDYINRR